jgi:hypothetical protein
MESNLNRLVLSLSKDEVRHFKLYIQKYDTNLSERKDLSLFDYVRKQGDKYEEDEIVKDLYGKGDKNSFYRLRNRLIAEINKSLLSQYYDETNLNGVLFHILLSRIFQEKRDFVMAHYFLRRAEKKAISASAHDLLDLIYADMIKISNETLEINPEDIIQQRKENRVILHNLQEFEDILAVLIYRIRVSQNMSKGNMEIMRLLNNTIKEFSGNKELSRNKLFRLKTYQAVSRILLQEQNFKALEKYLVNTYKEFVQDHLFDKNSHDTKLGMLTYLVNALFKNKKYKESIAYADMLRDAMQEYGGILHEKYLIYYYNAMVYNYTNINKYKAIEILLEAQQDPLIGKNKFNLTFVNLQLVLQYFDIKEYKKSNKLMVRVRIEENFRMLDQIFQLKILIIELMIRFELQDFDFIESQIPKVRKEYVEQLKEPTLERQKLMLDFLRRAIQVDRLNRDKQLISLAQVLLEETETDSDLINYKEWILSKGF